MLRAAVGRSQGIRLVGPVVDRISRRVAAEISWWRPRVGCPDTRDSKFHIIDHRRIIDFRTPTGCGSHIGGAIDGLDDPLSLNIVLGRATVRCNGAYLIEVDCCRCVRYGFFVAKCHVHDWFDFIPGERRSTIYNFCAGIWDFHTRPFLERPRVSTYFDVLGAIPEEKIIGCEPQETSR